jgi:hypothetical protein
MSLRLDIHFRSEGEPNPLVAKKLHAPNQAKNRQVAGQTPATH